MTLIGYWPLNEESGSKAYDHSGNENHGTLNGGITQGATGLLGNSAYSFDGSDDEVQIGDHSVYTVQSFSISAWIKLNSKGEFGIISNYGGGGSNEHYGLRYGSNNGDGSYRANMYYDDGGASGYGFTQLYGNKDVGDGKWHHVAGTWDGSAGLTKIYVDGVAENSSRGEYTGTIDPSASFLIGNDAAGSHFQLDGKISEVRIYNRPLTKSEIQYLYSVGKRGLQTTSKKTS